MKRDVVIAVVIGFIVGAGSAVFIVNLPSLIKRGIPSQITINNPTPSPAQMTRNPYLLEITSPQNEDLASSKNITLSGKTNPGATLVLDTEQDNYVKEASSDGNFSFALNLHEGTNKLFITAYNEIGETETKTITVYYTVEKL